MNKSNMQKPLFEKLISILLIVITIVAYFIARRNQFENIQANSKASRESVQTITLDTINSFYNSKIDDDFIANTLHKSFSNELLNTYEKVNSTIQDSNLNAEIKINKVTGFKTYKIEKNRGYTYNANVSLDIFTKNGTKISSENKELECLLVEEEDSLKILSLTLTNENK